MFLKTLQGIRQGAAINEVDDELQKLVRKIKANGGAGELKLTLKIRPLDASGMAVHIDTDVSVKVPKPIKEKAVFFFGSNGDDVDLVKNDPRQGELKLRQVEAPRTEVRQIEVETPTVRTA